MEGMVFIIILLFIAIFFPCYFGYLKSKLEHKKVIAAIEKGVPLPDLSARIPDLANHTQVSPRWIRSFALAAGFLVASISCFSFVAIKLARRGYICDDGPLFFGCVFLSLTVFFAVLGFLGRKVSDHTKNETSKNKPAD